MLQENRELRWKVKDLEKNVNRFSKVADSFADLQLRLESEQREKLKLLQENDQLKAEIARLKRQIQSKGRAKSRS